MKKTLCAMLFGSAVLSSVGSIQAATLPTEKVNIPFEFHVSNKSLPAGVYRVEQEFGTDVAMLVNTRTGQRVHVLRPSTARHNGATRLTFVPDGTGLKLKIS